MDKKIKIRIEGNKINPATMKSKELADFITNIEEMLVSTMVSDHDDIKRDDCMVSLTGLEANCVSLNFVPNYYGQAVAAYEKITHCVKDGLIGELTEKTVEALVYLKKFSSKNKCEVFMLTAGNKVLAKINHETDVALASPIITGTTTVYGTLLRVGGKEPKIMVETEDEETLYCKVTEKLAKDVAHLVYSRVMMNGVAKWNSSNWEMVEFVPQDVTKMSNESYSESMDYLSAKYGDHFGDIADPVSYARNLRNGDA